MLASSDTAVAVVNKECGTRLVFSIVHVSEFGQIRFHVLACVMAPKSRALLSVFAAALKLDLVLIAMTDICLALSDQLDCKLIELLKIVA